MHLITTMHEDTLLQACNIHLGNFCKGVAYVAHFRNEMLSLIAHYAYTYYVYINKYNAKSA